MEVCFQLPDSAARSGQMTAMFADLEKMHDILGISSYGISDTSLEEVSWLFQAVVMMVVMMFCLVLQHFCFVFK